MTAALHFVTPVDTFFYLDRMIVFGGFYLIGRMKFVSGIFELLFALLRGLF